MNQPENEAHPLFQGRPNQKILKKICRFLPTSDLKSFRLVCKKWHTLSLKQWRDSNTLVLCNCKVCRKLPDGNGKNAACPYKLTLPQFLVAVKKALILKLSKVPYTRYKLRRWNFANQVEPRNQLKFWEQFGAEITYLEINRSTILRGKSLTDTFYQRLPQLRTLCIVRTRWMKWKRTRVNPLYPNHTSVCGFLRTLKLIRCGLDRIELCQVFHHCPFLEELLNEREIWRHERRRISTSRNQYNLLEAIRDARAWEGHVFDLKILKMMNVITGGMRCCTYFRRMMNYEQFEEARFPLQEIRIDVGERVHQRSIQRIFSVHAETMEVMTLFRNPTCPPYLSLTVGIEMEKMRELYIYGLIMQSFAFLKAMPNLKVFKLQRHCYDVKWKMNRLRYKEIRFMLPWRKCYVESTKKLWAREGTELGRDGKAVGKNMESFEVDFQFGKKSVRALSRWMPNLKTLRIIGNEETVQVVAKKWPKLKELTLLYGSELGDEGVAGHGGLVGMEWLKKFTLESYCNKGKLTGMCVRNGFLRMRRLRELDVYASDYMTLEDEALLKEHIGNVRVRRNNGEHEEMCCERFDYQYSTEYPDEEKTTKLKSRTVVWPKEGS